MSELTRLLQMQAGVISRRQVLDLGLVDADVRRLLRRREWTVLHPGVYVDHTGPPTWAQWAWAAVLSAPPGVLGGRSALHAAGVHWDHRDDAPIEITIPRHRTQRPVDRVVVRRSDHTWARALRHTSPPRLRVEDAALDLATSVTRETDLVAVLAAVVSSRHTTADRLLANVADRARVPRRALVLGILTDVADGTHSALEHAYLTRVERPHQLPRSRRQVPARTGTRAAYRDVIYEEFGLAVELDGHAFHSTAEQRDADLDRDLERAAQGSDGVRLGWAQVLGHGCRTAHTLGRLLQRRGWTGRASPGPCCPTAR